MFDTSKLNLSNAFTFRKREELLQKSKECETEGKQEQAWKLKGQAIEVTYDHVVPFVKVREAVKIICFFWCCSLNLHTLAVGRSFICPYIYLWKVYVERGIMYIVTPYEADAQIALLLSEGYADIAITEDSDLLAYGCREVNFEF